MADKKEAPKQKYDSLLPPVDPAEEQRLRESRAARRASASAAAQSSSFQANGDVVSIAAPPKYDPYKKASLNQTERDKKNLGRVVNGIWVAILTLRFW